jgi:hypothetical protein
MGRDCRRGISTLAALDFPLRPAMATFKSTRAAPAPFCRQGSPQFRAFGRTAGICLSAGFFRPQPYLFSLIAYSSPSGRSVGISNFHSCTPFEGYSLQCLRQLDTFIFKELKFDAALLVQHSYTPRMRSTQPVSPAAHLTARPTAAPLCFRRVGPAHPAGRGLMFRLAPGHGLVLGLLRATAWCCTSSGPR